MHQAPLGTGQVLSPLILTVVPGAGAGHPHCTDEKAEAGADI